MIEETKEVLEVVKDTVDSSADAMNLVVDGMDKLAQAAANILDKYAEPAAELALNVLRIDALSHLIPAIVGLIIALIVYRSWPWVVWYKDSAEREGLVAMIIIVGGLVASVFITMATIKLLNIWLWIGLVYPEIYAVHKFILN
jgi:hypothetical protein